MKINAQSISDFQLERTTRWHSEEPSVAEKNLLELVEENHRCNFLLWHEEDKARRDDLGFEYVYRAKRNIDRYNQARNDFVEKMDIFLANALHPVQDSSVPANSETPGFIIDRLSILALKEYHMAEQLERKDASAEHITSCEKKLAVIRLQRKDLTQCLEELFSAIQQKNRSFKVYYQFKMYNDPSYRRAS